MDSFRGADGGSTAAGEESAVLGGVANEACADLSAIGGGDYNVVFGSGTSAFIGGGFLNRASGEESFVGAGTLVSATGSGSVVGGGGVTYYFGIGHSALTPGTIASGRDSFVGAGDLNQVTGQGSFIGAGGSSYAQSGANAISNEVDGVDSFIGAGDRNMVLGSWSFVGGGEFNTILGKGSFIGAGGYLDATTNSVASFISGTDSFIGAGDENEIDANRAFLGGGQDNTIAAAATNSVIAGGANNAVSAIEATLCGGHKNAVSGSVATVGGGYANSATGNWSTIPGGYLNAANGIASFAAGSQAKARHNGTFVWSDDAGPAVLQSTAPYQFLARASSGFFLFSDASDKTGVSLPAGSGTWAMLSDRAAKTKMAALDDAGVLAKVAALPVSEWSYTSEPGVRHVGPMAQDFYAAFRVGEDDRHITSIDEDGVALSAIKALHAENRTLHAENRDLHAENEGLRERLTRDEGQRARDGARLRSLERTVAMLAVETHLSVPSVKRANR